MSQGGDIVGVPQLSQALPSSPTAGSAEQALKQISAAAMAGSPTAGSMVALLKQLYTDAMAAGGTAGSLYETLRKLTAVAVPAMDDASVIYNSLFYRLMEIEKHFHNSSQLYGLTTNTMARKANSPIVVLGGQQVWGTEIQLHDGTVIESGSATKKFDLHELYLTNVTNADRPTYLEFWYGTVGADVAATIQDAGNTLTKAGHGLIADQKLMLNTIVTSTGINTYTLYYVYNVVGDTFQLSLTDSTNTPAAVAIGGGDGTCNYGVVTASLLTESIISASATNADAMPTFLMSPRVACNSRLWVRGKTTTANTNTLSFYLGLHTYPA